jgi:hypothetical protein
MRSRLERNSTARHPAEGLFRRLRAGRDLRFQNHFLLPADRTIEARPISNVKPNRQLPILQLANPTYRPGGNLLYCRSPLSPAPLSASITWELNIPPEPAFSYHLLATVEPDQQMGNEVLDEGSTSMFYSQRRAVIGFNLTARRAGM